MALISFAVTAKLICVFVFAYAKSWFSHNEAHFIGNFSSLMPSSFVCVQIAYSWSYLHFLPSQKKKSLFLFQIKNVNIFDENLLSEELRGQDALVSCLGGPPSLFKRKSVTIYTDSAKALSGAARKSGLGRLIMMSGWPITGTHYTTVYCCCFSSPKPKALR